MLASKFATVYHLVSQVSGEWKGTVSSSIQKTLGYTFYTVDEFFMVHNTIGKVFIVYSFTQLVVCVTTGS